MTQQDFFSHLRAMLLEPNESQRQQLIREALVGVFGFPKVPQANRDDQTFIKAIQEYSRVRSEFIASGIIPEQYREKILHFFNEAVQREPAPSFEAIVVTYVMKLYKKAQLRNSTEERAEREFMADVISPTDTTDSREIADEDARDFERVSAAAKAEFPEITAAVLTRAIELADMQTTVRGLLREQNRKQQLQANRRKIEPKRDKKKLLH
ncbi:MAG: hypothetical protein HYV32_03110 [Candidatus Kerfeldbacteria bacterium]|nr:hypothetical protein [Candidatus Kerfeldbacteria bacterium]